MRACVRMGVVEPGRGSKVEAVVCTYPSSAPRSHISAQVPMKLPVLLPVGERSEPSVWLKVRVGVRVRIRVS